MFLVNLNDMTARYVTILIVSTLFFPIVVTAQDADTESSGYNVERHTWISFDVGVPSGDFANGYKAGIGVTLGEAYPINEYSDLEVRIGYRGNQFDDAVLSEGVSVDGGNARIFTLMGNGRIRPSSKNFSSDYDIVPYAIAGGGLFHYRVTDATVSETTRSEEVSSSSETAFGYTVGVGVQGKENLGGRFEIAYVTGQTTGAPISMFAFRLTWMLDSLF